MALPTAIAYAELIGFEPVEGLYASQPKPDRNLIFCFPLIRTRSDLIKLELVLKLPNVVPEGIGSLKRGNIIDTIWLFLANLAVLAFSLPENDLRQPLYLVVSKSMNNFSLGDLSIFRKRILGTGPKLRNNIHTIRIYAGM